ncbi:tRNA-dihydrouridine synthase [Atopobiaceae bacterium 24-176]
MAVQTAGELLATYGPQAGLAPAAAPFARVGSLAERLAANPFLIAPMAGVTDGAYRLMARAGGAALAVSEMVSVAGLHYANEKTWQLVDPLPEEPDIVVQLFGYDPAQFAEAAATVTERVGGKLAAIDVNMACPVPKVTRKGEGSALLDEPERAAAIIEACRQGAGDAVPVTAKIRIGRRPGKVVAPAFAARLEEAGVAAVAVHGRFASQFYRGESDTGAVAGVVRAVSVPVIASGDALDATAAARLKEDTGACAVYCARGTYGNPWIFGDAARVLTGEPVAGHGVGERLAAFALHVRLLEATGAHLARARSLAGWYLKGMPDAASWRERAMHCDTADDYLALIEAVATQ